MANMKTKAIDTASVGYTVRRHGIKGFVKFIMLCVAKMRHGTRKGGPTNESNREKKESYYENKGDFSTVGSQIM